MKNLTATKIYALAFGLFLGLCIWKFGNPVILDQKISAPATPSEFFKEPWPTHWANWIFLLLTGLGALLIFQNKIAWRESKWLWWLPLVWLSWQFISATQTEDADLTGATLWQFSGCVACYFLGALIFARDDLWRWLLPGLLAAFVFCLVRGIDQHVFEFPENRLMLMEGERAGWTNVPPENLAQMKADKIIITTNGIDVANPVILDKFKKGRVAGTLVYPNALAGIILLLWPLSLALAFGATKKLRPPVRFAAIGLTIFLGSTAMVWSGSKLGWLIAIGSIEEMLAQDPNAPARSEAFWANTIENCHTQLGLALAARWNLPAVLLETIGMHHQPDEPSEFAPFIELVAISDRINDLLLDHPLVSAEQLSVIPELTDREREALARMLPTIPELISAFASDQPNGPSESKLLAPQNGMLDGFQPASLAVTKLGTRKSGPFKLVGIGPNGWVMRGTEPLLEKQLVEMEIAAKPMPIRLWAKVDLCVSGETSGWEFECKPFALSQTSLQQWNELVRTHE